VRSSLRQTFFGEAQGSRLQLAAGPQRRDAAAPGSEQVELAQRLVARLPAVGRTFLQAPHDERGERGWDSRADPVEGLDFSREAGGGELPRMTTAKGGQSGQHLVGHQTCCVDVDPMVDIGIAGRLLGRHVRRGADREPGRGERGCTGGGVERLGQAEVSHLNVGPHEQHILGLNVAVDDPLAVGVGERIEHFA